MMPWHEGHIRHVRVLSEGDTMATNASSQDSRTRATVILTGVLLGLLGIFIIANPGQTLEIVVQLLGWGLVVFGIAILIEALVHRGAPGVPVAMTQRRIAGGVCSAVFGAIILMNPRFFVSYIFVLLGIVVIITGINDVLEASAARKLGLPVAHTLTIMAVITLALGVLLLVAPFGFASAATVIAGIVLLFDGITEVIAGIRMP
jgi:uncharacterized membrane protein HdeD (DUF308 family)